MVAPGFLHLDQRAVPPRSVGLTHVIDGGIPLGAMADVLRSAGHLVDVWKFGWGTAYLDPLVSDKLRLLADHDIRACTGGTLLEVAWLQGQASALFEWAAEMRFPHVEISNGVARMPLTEKRRLIREAARRFTVLSEVGSKDPTAMVSAADWATEAVGDLDAGARWVLAEGRESGTVGVYDAQGSVRADVVDALARELGPERVVFEAPGRRQQAWFIRRFGADVNLGNIATGDVLALETLRVGLRADTIVVPDPLLEHQERR